MQPEYTNSIGRKINFAMSAINSLTTELLKEYDLSPTQWVALSVLWMHDGVSLKTLTEYMRTAKSATSRLIGRMESQGLIERRTVLENRRVIQIFLTDAGKKLEYLSDINQQVNSMVLAGLSKVECNEISKSLERIELNAINEIERLKLKKQNHEIKY